MARTDSSHFIGAYGMFWQRDAVNWYPGTGGAAWQLLGRINVKRPIVRVCDFRTARGFYVLFDDFRATYVGLARGDQGIGSRLRRHVVSRQDWSRFCWFSFDDVVDAPAQHWSQLQRRDALRSSTPEMVLRECEALLITVLGSRDQNEMRFAGAQRWDQLQEADFLVGGIARKVDPGPYTDPRYKQLLRGSS